MKILLFEFVCSGGCYAFPGLGEPSGSLLSEGIAMLQAVFDEFSTIEKLEFQIPLDDRCADSLPSSIGQKADIIRSGEQLQQYLDLASKICDKIFIIAPEIENALLRYTQQLETSGKLLSPGVAVVRLGSDKWATHQFLIRHQIPTPPTAIMEAYDFQAPWSQPILKPRWGAGSWGLKRLGNSADVNLATTDALAEYLSDYRLQPHSTLVQQYVSGTPASIGVWQTGQRQHVFPAMQQCLDSQSWECVGCEGPLTGPEQQRARRLLDQVLENLSSFQGYVGIDIVLGKDDCDQDYVIEINPRLTTSFCTTRNLVDMGFISEIFEQ